MLAGRRGGTSSIHCVAATSSWPLTRLPFDGLIPLVRPILLSLFVPNDVAPMEEIKRGFNFAFPLFLSQFEGWTAARISSAWRAFKSIRSFKEERAPRDWAPRVMAAIERLVHAGLGSPPRD